MATRANTLRQLAKNWPKDPVRPNLQFGELLNYVAENSPEGVPARGISAVKALQSNHLMKKYPISPRTTKPASFPHHYDRLVLGYENATKGKTRSWFQIIFGIYK
ncbi:hypothetical protein FRB99_007257 [Tulasnella sp. 403]|nr:hypothetical protein FRB99_007257 [Tulasnella sp. 403]